MINNLNCKSKIIYTGSFRFPDGDAAAARVLGIGKALRAAGHEVVYAGWEERGRRQDLQKESYVYQGFPYFPQGDLPTEAVSPLKRVLRFIRYGQNTLRWLETQDLRGVKAIIAYHGGSWFLAHLTALCSKQGIRLVIDCTEWYSPYNLPGGRLGLPYLDNVLRMRILNVRAGRVIAISSYLERYYTQRGCAVLRVPPLVDLGDEKWQSLRRLPEDDGALHLVYAGTPAKKDLLGNALRGLNELAGERHQVKLHLVGPSREAVAACLGSDAHILERIDKRLVYHGRIPQEEVPGIVSRAHFSVLLRPRERYAEAGFPTKLVESLAAGTPVLVNPTSDIGNYVHDNREGLLLDDHSVSSFVSGVKRALSLSPEEVSRMRASARSRAQESFDYTGYVECLDAFVAGDADA